MLSRDTLLDYLRKMLPFLLHPNKWIQEEVLNYIYSLTEVFTQAQTFCFVRPLLFPYLKENIILIKKGDFEPFLRESLSRLIFDFEVRGRTYDLVRTKEDNHSLTLMEEILKYLKLYESNYNYEQVKRDQYAKYEKTIQRIKRYKGRSLWDVLKLNKQTVTRVRTTISKHSKEENKNLTFDTSKFLFDDLEDIDDYIDKLYYEFKTGEYTNSIKENFGLNSLNNYRRNTRMKGSRETWYRTYHSQWIRKALNFAHENIELGQIRDKVVIIPHFRYIYLN